MNFNWKMILFLVILGGLVWINYRFKNVITRGYNFLSQFPKLILAAIGIMIVVAPFLLKDNSVVNTFKDFLPDSMSKQIDVINGLKNMETIPVTVSTKKKFTGTTRDRRKVPEQLKKKVASDQGWRCKHCGNVLDSKYEVDHILALEDDGDNKIDNLQALCRNCHGKKTLSDDIKRKYPGGKLY